MNSKQLVLISALSALGGLGRVAFAALPDVKPTTFIVIASGYVMGPLAGFVTGAMSAVISNFFFGQGPWTPWQMFAWGLGGALAGFAGKAGLKFNRVGLAAFCGAWGYIFGWIMNVWTWYSYTSPHSLRGYVILCIASFWWDTLHALASIAFSWMFGREFINIVSRFKQKMSLKYL